MIRFCETKYVSLRINPSSNYYNVKNIYIKKKKQYT